MTINSKKKTEMVDNEKELKDKVIEVLQTIYDPEIPVNIFELGLIYEIKIFPVNKVFILMTLTSPNCPVAESLPQDVKNAVQSIEGISECELELTFDPPYTTEMMSEAAKLELGFM